ncbi:MAG: cobalamin-dependent protein [Steroidobacteraceae bacterium]|jgi:methanogenic corrinoid protein MtbC1|nr:cobalamin-dependent protein [Steroidobacteraceae bacterium]
MVDYRMVREEDDASAERSRPAQGCSDAQVASQPRQQRRDQLLQTIEGEIIPRLMLVHRVADGQREPAARAHLRPEAADVEMLARIVLEGDTERSLDFVEGLLQRGVPLDSIYLDLLAPTARHLGKMWETDQSDFMQVTIGLWRLQEVLHELGPAFLNESEPAEPGRRVFLVPVPGDQHTFGTVIVAEFLRRAGWDVWDDPGASKDEILRIVRKEWFAVVGLSVSCEQHLEGLPSVIRAIRRASRNPSVGIMVGGQPFTDHPERVALVGADATASDGRQAALQAQKLVSLLASRA